MKAALPPNADIRPLFGNVRLVPMATTLTSAGGFREK
jgi:hypothetical protein